MKTRIMAVVVVVLLLLSPSWVSAFEHCPADINGDGEVGPADLAMLLASWGPCSFCGDGNVDPGEDCDPPDGVTCDDNCQLQPTDCCFPHGFPAGCEELICEFLVCSQDPFCCINQWDALCAVAAAGLCPECFGIDCCFEHFGAGCTDPVCEEIVCGAFIPLCCSDGWDNFCVDIAELFCDQCMP